MGLHATTKRVTDRQFSLRRFFLKCSVVLVLLFGIHCAHRMPPPGGPPDRTPPSIVRTNPENGTTHFKGNKVRLRFNQYVDERSVEESIFISPYVGELEFDWSGKEVEITFSRPLQTNTTYVVTVGTDVTGYYTRTRMEQAYTLAFSTGDHINRGTLSGVVVPRHHKDAKSGIMVYAFRIDGMDPDTLNPSVHSPDFMTQTGTRGEFAFVHIPWGTYRLIAVRDEYRNFLYDQEVDEYGVPPHDYVVSEQDSSVFDITLQLAKEDTTAPRIVKAVAVHEQKVEVTFSEPLTRTVLTPESWIITDTTTQSSLEVFGVVGKPQQPKSVLILTGKQDSSAFYRITVVGVTDSAGNIINPYANTMIFVGSSVRDTNRCKFESLSLKDTLGVPLQPTITFTFSDALDTTTIANCFSLYIDSARVVPVRISVKDLCVLQLEPQQELQSSTTYTLRANFTKLRSWKNEPIADSVRQWRFKTLDVYELSSISGTVHRRDTVDAPLVLVAIRAETLGETIVPVDKTGVFHFPRLESGKYSFKIFEDRNGNRRYDVGKPYPFVPSERLKVYSDTIRVRPRWPLEGIQFTF